MFISHKYKTIFIHIQKTGGDSVENIFRKKNRRLITRISLPSEILRTKHCYISDMYNVVDKKILNSYTKFCVVRNPFDRMVSWYSMFKHKTGVFNDVMSAVNNNTNTFRDFILLPNKDLFHRFYVNQIDYISINNKIFVDEILMFENLNEDFNIFKQKINFKATLPHKNKSIREKDYRKYYDDELIEIVYKRFKKDFDYFNYTF